MLTMQHHVFQQTRTFWMQEPNEDNCNVFQLQPKETISAFSFLSQPHYSVPKLRASGSDRVSKSSFLAFKHTSFTVNLNMYALMVITLAFWI